MSKFFPKNRQNICNSCKWSKDRFRESCYCTMFGIIISYGRADCRGYEQIQKQESSDCGRDIRQLEGVSEMEGVKTP